MPAEVHALVFALVREHLKNRGFKEAAAAFKEEYGAGSGGISSLKTLCAELNVTEQHRGRRRAGLKGSVMMSLLEKIFSKTSERHSKPHKKVRRSVNAAAVSSGARATLAGFGFDVVEEVVDEAEKTARMELSQSLLQDFDVLESAELRGHCISTPAIILENDGIVEEDLDL